MGGAPSQSSGTQQLVSGQSSRQLATVKVERTLPQDERRIKDMTRLMTAKSWRNKQLERDKYEDTKENTQLLKHLFKKMDPSVMRTSAQTNRGEIQLSFKYEVTQELLLVKVIKCSDLSAKDLRGQSSDPYVKLFMYPLTSPSEARQTHVTLKTLNPTYHEIFTFPVVNDQLQSGKMIVQVWDKDLMDRDDLIGEAIIQLRNFDFGTDPVHTAWYTLQAETDLEITGNLDISLKYELPSTLNVTINRGQHLTNHYQGHLPNPFVKVQIPGVAAVFETEVKEGTVDPVWNQTFDFPIAVEEFEERYIIFHVIDSGDIEQNNSLGQVVIDLKNFDPDNGYHGTFDLADLKNSERLRSKWFQHATVQEFREALLAHSTFRQPKFLFQKHDGTKVIRVTSRQAGAQAKLRIVDGVPVY